MRAQIFDRFINGIVAFESDGNRRAIMSYTSKAGVPIVPLGTHYTIENQEWRVVAAAKSNYNAQTINVNLELV